MWWWWIRNVILTKYTYMLCSQLIKHLWVLNLLEWMVLTYLLLIHVFFTSLQPNFSAPLRGWIGGEKITKTKSLIELWVTTFLPNWQLPLIFVLFISNFFCMCSNSMASAPCDFEVNQTKIKGGCQLGRKVVTHNSKSDVPLDQRNLPWIAYHINGGGNQKLWW